MDFFTLPVDRLILEIQCDHVILKQVYYSFMSFIGKYGYKRTEHNIVNLSQHEQQEWAAPAVRRSQSAHCPASSLLRPGPQGMQNYRNRTAKNGHRETKIWKLRIRSLLVKQSS